MKSEYDSLEAAHNDFRLGTMKAGSKITKKEEAA
jgi:hypothetical protein